MPPTASVTLFAFDTLASASNRELAVGAFLVLAILYLIISTLRSRPRRDRRGRFRSKRRTQFLGLLKIGAVVALLWLGASITGVI